MEEATLTIIGVNSHVIGPSAEVGGAKTVGKIIFPLSIPTSREL